MIKRQALSAACAAMLLTTGCATVPVVPGGTVEMRLLPGQSAVAGVDGPYAVYSREVHAIVLRVWPECTQCSPRDEPDSYHWKQQAEQRRQLVFSVTSA